MSRRLNPAHALIAAGLVLGLAACGSDGPDTAAGSTGKQSTEAVALVQQARDAARGAGSVKVSGTAKRSGRTYTYALAVANGQGERDAVTVGGGSLRYLKVGNDAFIRISGDITNSELGGSATALAGKLRSSWLAIDPAALPGMAGSFQDIMGFLGKYPTTDSVLSQLVPAQAKFHLGGRSAIKGVPVTRVDFDAPMPPDVGADLTSQGLAAPARLTGSVFVAAEGTPYPLAVKTNTGVDLTLAKWDKPVDLQKPAKRRLVTIDQLLGGGSAGMVG